LDLQWKNSLLNIEFLIIKFTIKVSKGTMRNLFLGLTLCVFPTVTFAEWVYVGQVPDVVKVYVDPATKSRLGNIGRIWMLTDYMQPSFAADGKPFYSSKRFNQYDCNEKMGQVQKIVVYTGKMLTGEVVGSGNQPSKMEPVQPSTVDNLVLRSACEDVVATSTPTAWVSVSINTAGDDFYADPTSKERTGNDVKMWVLRDYVKPKTLPSGKSYQSERVYFEYDCAHKSTQTLKLYGFSGKMASGEVVISLDTPSNVPVTQKTNIIPGTSGEIILNFACK
jgi:hypothetical protein